MLSGGKPMSDRHYRIQELGGAELALHYPDKGLLPDSGSYNSIVQTEPQVDGFLSWLRSFKHSNSFVGVLCARTDGLRIFIAVDDFAVFIPWAEATASAERGWLATTVRVKTSAVPSLTLVFNLDDDAADDLFRSAIPALPRRAPHRRLWWGTSMQAGWAVSLAVAVSAGLIGWLIWRVK